MLRHVTVGLIGLAASLASPVMANVIITLEPVSKEMDPTTGGVPTATQVTVNILLSADGVDSPLLDVRQMRFDFSKTSSTLKLGEFRWTFDSLDNAGLHLTDEDRRAKLRSFTGEPVQNASMRMIYSREAARALFVLSKVTGEPVAEAGEHCASVFGEEEAASREPRLH